MSVKDDLIAARALIDTPEKWGRITRFDIAEGKVSANAAIKMVAENDYLKHSPIFAERYREMHRMIERVAPALDSPFVLATYNNDPDTTHADILALFDRAIEAAE